MEFENITVTDEGVVRLKRITIVIPFYNDRDKEIEITTSNRELIHIAIGNNRIGFITLLNIFNGICVIRFTNQSIYNIIRII